MYDCIFSDHHPVLVKADLNIQFEQEHSNYLKRHIHWEKLPLNVIRLYKQYTNDGFSSITLPHGVKCTNPNCSCPSHANDIDELYDNIIKVLSECSEKLKSDKHNSKTYSIPGWNDSVKDLHEAARDAYLLWKHSGKPRQGVVYDVMKQARAKFKYALRVCKSNKNSIISDKIAESMCVCVQRMTGLSGEIKNYSNSKLKLPNAVGDAQRSDNISVMWQEHYSHNFNMVSESNCKSLHADLCKEDSLFDNDMIVTASEIEEIIKDLACNKSPGLDGISSEYIKFAGHQLLVLLSILMSAVPVHGYVPKSMLKSVIVPIIKNKNKRTSDKDNYRPICISNVFTKVVEKVLYSRMDDYLQSTNNQFGTEMCVFVLKELIRYYIKHGSCMYVAFLDASNAFDRVNHTELFSKLLVFLNG